jgi:hypothetical protein
MSTAGQTNHVTAVAHASSVQTQEARRSRYSTILAALFLLSLPIINPWVRGDGVGYYAYVRALLIEHSLRFENDWLAANPTFQQARLDANGHLLADQYTRTGYIKNHFSIGPSMLWAPFLMVAHAAVLTANRLGTVIPADGYSSPYLVTMAVATALYGFAGLFFSFDLARGYFEERWAFLATLGIWCASSLPVYMYFNPSWSHAHSAFAVALFLWYWQRTRNHRSLWQWFLLGLSAGLMMNVYYPNAILLLVPGVEAMVEYRRVLQQQTGRLAALLGIAGTHAFFIIVAGLALLPTFVVRRIIDGNAFESDYPAVRYWSWASPALLRVLFSGDHGMLSWTPILIPAILGLLFFWRRDPLFGGAALLSFLAYYYFIASYPDWDGISSFGNRFFVSLTPLFVLGLAAFLDFFARKWNSAESAVVVASSVIGALIVWNAGLIFQWGTNMIPARGFLPWSEMIHNQYTAVPQRIGGDLETYFLRRKAMMRQIEGRDLKEQQAQPESHAQ